jgi:hypothetical protein
MPEELMDLKAIIEKKMKIVESPGSASVKLVSDKLTIEFDIRVRKEKQKLAK